MSLTDLQIPNTMLLNKPIYFVHYFFFFTIFYCYFLSRFSKCPLTCVGHLHLRHLLLRTVKGHHSQLLMLGIEVTILGFSSKTSGFKGPGGSGVPCCEEHIISLLSGNGASKGANLNLCV